MNFKIQIQRSRLMVEIHSYHGYAFFSLGEDSLRRPK